MWAIRRIRQLIQRIGFNHRLEEDNRPMVTFGRSIHINQEKNAGKHLCRRVTERNLPVRYPASTRPPSANGIRQRENRQVKGNQHENHKTRP